MGSSEDIYDFHDDSDRDEDCFNFTIDETPPKKQRKPGIKMRLPGKNFGNIVNIFQSIIFFTVKTKLSRLEEGEGSNGIESLIQASALSVP